MKGLLAALALTSVFAAKAFPPPPSSYIHNEDVISAADAAELGERLRAVEERTGHQFVVALFQSLEGESLEDYTNRLFKYWKIGQAKTNDGLLFSLFLQDRGWRVDVGYGLEGTITDLEAAEFARAGVPYFKNGDYAGGVRAVVEGLAGQLEGTAPHRRPARRSARSQPINPLALLILIVLGFGFILWLQVWNPSTIGRRYRNNDWWGGWGGGGWGGGGGWSGGGFSGGGGSSGGGGASGGW